MMNVLGFEESIKSSKSVTDNILDLINFIGDSKLTGVSNKEEVEEVMVLEDKLFANLVKQGKKTEEDVESFETLIPSDYEQVLKIVKEQDTESLLQKETRDKLSTPVEGFSKGLRRVA